MTPFALLPALGFFTERYHGEERKVWATADPPPPTAYFAVTGERKHAASANRIAFWVESPEEDDRVAKITAAAEPSGPKPMPYAPGYYAAYSNEPSGNRLEVYVRPG